MTRPRRSPTTPTRSASRAGADLIAAVTMTYAGEAIGVARAATRAGAPGGDLVHGRDRRQAAERRKRSATAIEQVDAETLASSPTT